jgi:tetrapyrrole methylase family protein/MazG family protein
MAAGITIVGLGPGEEGMMTLEARRVIDQAPVLFLRTLTHPAARDIAGRRPAHAFDEAYDGHATFEAVYREIVERVMDAGRSELGAVYAVPGDPMVGEATTTALVEAARAEGLPLRLVHAPSFLEPSLAAAGFDPLDGIQVADGLEVARQHFPPLSPDRPVLLGQVYSRLVASEIKLTLLAQYPPDHRLLVLDAAGTGQARSEWLQLEELDRSERFSAATSLFVPALPAPSSLESLQETVAHLRAPDGCPWDREQTHQSLRPHVREEAYEVLQAIDQDDPVALREELGDLLLQIVMQTQIGAEGGTFTMAEVIAGIQAKLIRRHPHVFQDVRVDGVDQVLANWERLKQTEREQSGESRSALEGVPAALPALAQAHELQARAARVGFDWRSIDGVREKLDEELAELAAAATSDQRASEIGDVLFALVNYARWLGVDPESSLRESNRRFRRRFAWMEEASRSAGTPLSRMDLEELDRLWGEAKARESGSEQEQP